MKFTAIALSSVLLAIEGKRLGEDRHLKTGNSGTRPPTGQLPGARCDASGLSRFPYGGHDNSQRLLLREGVTSEVPQSLCGNENGKNVILVVGDGMGWEVRSFLYTMLLWHGTFASTSSKARLIHLLLTCYSLFR